ncbi:hypothetical protein BBF96_04285 [Anoxybacter fermentans]|uniref:DUF2877 domain-containing protein n=1 Tax=Anoxybacter fermentans TaxID=1323375 RepID=A0A3S9SWL3_9FIRM|nr:DUF2877 domain-containing protein [Anoxybacter fermentans]AZR72675.1 hypothetical protein BBF96_04285 [Anoxybacter fermentans]
MKTRELKAKSIGDLLYSKLMEKSLNGEIHSIFSSVINVKFEEELYTIGKSQIGNGPLTVLLPVMGENLNKWGLAPGDPVFANRMEINLNNFLRIDLKDAQIWSSKWQNRPNFNKNFQLLSRARAMILREGNLNGLGGLLEDQFQFTSDTFIEYNQKILIKMAIPSLNKIKEGLLKRSEIFWNGVRELVGLGPGLTPASDDLLVGFLLTFRYLESAGLYKLPDFNLATFSKWVKSKTNLISAMGLILAFEGRPLEFIRDAIQNLFNGEKIKTILSILRLIDRGSTSGTDILTGIILAGEVFQQIYKTQCYNTAELKEE